MTTKGLADLVVGVEAPSDQHADQRRPLALLLLLLVAPLA